MIKRRFFLLLFLMLLFLLAGCVESEYQSNYKNFKESYILATNFLENEKDPLKALEKVDISMLESELENMKTAMEKMEDEKESKTEKGIYGNVKIYYESIEFLLYAAKNIDNLSIDERGRVYTEAVIILLNRDSIKEGKE